MKSKRQSKSEPDLVGMAEATIANSRAEQKKRRNRCNKCKHWIVPSYGVAWCWIAPRKCCFEARR